MCNGFNHITVSEFLVNGSLHHYLQINIHSTIDKILFRLSGQIKCILAPRRGNKLCPDEETSYAQSTIPMHSMQWSLDFVVRLNPVDSPKEHWFLRQTKADIMDIPVILASLR